VTKIEEVLKLVILELTPQSTFNGLPGKLTRHDRIDIKAFANLPTWTFPF